MLKNPCLRYVILQYIHAHIHTPRTFDENVRALQTVLLSYSYVLLFRDMIDGSLRGMMLLGFVRTEEYTTIKLGISLFKNYYKGGPAAYLAVGYFIFKGEKS